MSGAHVPGCYVRRARSRGSTPTYVQPIMFRKNPGESQARMSGDARPQPSAGQFRGDLKRGGQRG